MSKRSPIFLSAIMLTGVHLLLRFVGTSFQVYLSNKIGAAGIGLLQLVTSVGMLSTVAGMAGIRTGTMYLAAEELGRKRPERLPWIISGCFRYSILFSCTVALVLYLSASVIAKSWIGDIRTEPIIKLYAAFLPVVCLCGVISGFYTAANKIGTLAAVEIAEQLISMGTTIFALKFYAGTSPVRACACVILGGCAGSVFSLVILLIMNGISRNHSDNIPIRQRLMQTALPLAAADILKAGINTIENLMVPSRLKRNANISSPLAAFGTVTGMVFPVIMFPCCILYALAELLVPELARCVAAGSHNRIRYLVKRSLKISLLYGLLFGGLIYLVAEELCLLLYHHTDAAIYLKYYALLIPMLYCDTITDAMTKGMGQQKICVRYNIITSAMDVILLYLLLPEFGMDGYFLSFFITHLINFILSLRRLLIITRQKIPLNVPIYAILGTLSAIILSGCYCSAIGKIIVFPAVLTSMLYLMHVIEKQDLAWIYHIVIKRNYAAT